MSDTNNPCEHQAAACRMREALIPFASFGSYIQKHPRNGLDDNLYSWDCDDKAKIKRTDLLAASAALSASGPCSHEVEVKRLKQQIEGLNSAASLFVRLALRDANEVAALTKASIKLRKTCADVALKIESMSHLVQDDELRAAMHLSTRQLAEAAEGREK